jgi:hypothetical protein
MNRTSCRALLCLVALAAAGCAQITTSSTEKAGLQSAADAAGDAYLACLSQEAERYLATTNEVAAIVSVARKNCAAARDAAGDAQEALQGASYIISDPQVEAALGSLDARGEAAITELALNRTAPARPATSATAPPAPVPPAPAATAATATAAGGDDYLACMQDQGARWATVEEPAAVIADAAHSRCAGKLSGAQSGADLEKAGRALVVGIVLDRKAGTPAARQ